MDYLTKYYKNLSEQLQEKINLYNKLIETYATIMPDPDERYPGRKPKAPSHLGEPTEEPDMSDWKYPHPMPRPSDSGVWEDGGGKFPSPKPYPYPGGGKEKMPPVKPPFIGKEKVPPTKPPFGKEKKPIKGELFDKEHLMGESTNISENIFQKVKNLFATGRWEDGLERYDREKEEESLEREVADQIEKDKKWRADRESKQAWEASEKKKRDEEWEKFARSKPAEYRSVSGRWVAPGQEMEYYDKPTRSMEEI